MAIKYYEDKDNVFEITNSNLKELKRVQKEYNIDGEANTLAFLISVGLRAKGNPIYINGKITQPSDEIKNKNDS